MKRFLVAATIVSISLIAFDSGTATPVSAGLGLVPLDSISATLASDGELTLSGAKIVHLKLDLKATQIVYYEIASVDGDGDSDLLRWHSQALYERLGQASPGTLIFSRDTKKTDIRSDPKNEFAKSYPIVDPISDTERDLVALHARIQAVNESKGRLACSADTGIDLLAGVEAGSCYAACSGQAVIVGQLAAQPTRVLLLQPRIDQIAPRTNFVRSEGHSTVEVMGAKGWELFDPTFGFAWVALGDRRLDAGGLIEALRKNQDTQLTFGVLREGVIHAVPGPDFLAGQPMLKGIYYTSDKQIITTGYGHS